MGEDLIERFKKNPLPIVSTFFTPAFMAEEFKYPAQIYCVICDADINRSWVALDPKKSKIKYFAPCTWAQRQIKTLWRKPRTHFFNRISFAKRKYWRKFGNFKRRHEEPSLI